MLNCGKLFPNNKWFADLVLPSNPWLVVLFQLYNRPRSSTWATWFATWRQSDTWGKKHVDHGQDLLSIATHLYIHESMRMYACMHACMYVSIYPSIHPCIHVIHVCVIMCVHGQKTSIFTWVMEIFIDRYLDTRIAKVTNGLIGANCLLAIYAYLSYKKWCRQPWFN